MKKPAKSSAMLIYSIMSLAGTLLALVLCALIVAKDAFCWFASNDKVTAGGANVSVKASTMSVEYVKLDKNGVEDSGGWQKIDLSSPIDVADDIKYPGESACFKLRITNTADVLLTIKKFGIEKPTENDETPRTVEKVQYWLSTQFKVSLVSVNTTNIAVPKEFFLRDEANPLEIGRINLLEMTHVPPDALTLQSRQSVEVTLKITFENTDKNQNVYKNFGANPEQEFCQRRLYIECN